MARSWANRGVDLHLDLAGSHGSRVRAGLEAGLRDAVRSGRLAPGTRLPSSRILAADLRIARNTVADAYGQLVAEGWLTARTGAGTWVADRPLAVPSAASLTSGPAGQPRCDLRAGVPALAAFPRRQWLAAARAAMNAVPDDVLAYPDPRGLPDLRIALARYLARARGVITSPERVLICAGFSHGLALIARVLAARGGTVFGTEEYGHWAHRMIVAAHGFAVTPLRVDSGGARPPGPLPDRVAAVLLTPAHQFPLGMTLAPRRRTAFVDWAVTTGGLVIEDDYDGEFRYDRQPVGALQALAPDHVVYAGTASKGLAPGLRLGWLAVPASVVDEVVAAKEDTGAQPGVLDQLTLASLIGSGGYDRQIRQARLSYRRRRDRLIGMLSACAPDVRITGIAAGGNAVATLPRGCEERDAVATAASHGVAVDGLSGYATDPAAHAAADVAALVVGYGRPAEHSFCTAVRRLCAAVAETVERGGAPPRGRFAAPCR